MEAMTPLDLNSTINNQIHLLGKRKSTALARQNWPEAIRVDAKLEVLEWLRREITKGQEPNETGTSKL